MRKSGPPKKLASAELLTYGMRLLAGRALSAGELRTRLQRRAADPADIQAIIDKLKEYGFVDDAKFAGYFASAKRDSGAAGQQRVLRDLRQRQVSASVASKATAEAFEGTDELQLIRDWLARKFRKTPLPEYLADNKHLASVYRKLRYAGFSSSAVGKVLREYSSTADELEDQPEDDA